MAYTRLPISCSEPSVLRKKTIRAFRFCVLLLVASHEIAAQPVTQVYANRRVAAVLDELRAGGLVFIYNNEIVPSGLRVKAEPTSQTGVALAAEILREHSLALKQVAPGVFAIVRSTDAVKSVPEKQPSPPASSIGTLDEIVVVSSRYNLSMQVAASSTSITQDQVKDAPRLADETLHALQRLPGTSTNGFSSIGSIRGGAPSETAIELDGLRLYEPFHLKNFLTPVSLLDSRLIHSIEFYSGGYPTSYGESMSAIVDATSIRSEQSRYFEAGLSLFHINALASLDIDDGRANVLVSARRSNADLLSRFSESDFGEPNYSDGFARFDYRWNEQTQTSLQTLVSGDRIVALKDGGAQRASAQYKSAYTWGTLNHEWSSRATSRLIASFSSIHNERQGRIDSPGRKSGNVVDLRSFHVAGIQLDNEYLCDSSSSSLGNACSYRYGVEFRRSSADYAYSSNISFASGFPFPTSPAMTLQRLSALNPSGYETSAYWDGRFALSDRWQAQLGLRFDKQTFDGIDDDGQWSPRTGFLYKLDDRTELRASWGRFFQSQGINELQVEDGVERFHPAQYADHSILSLNHALTIGFDVRLEAYRKEYRRLSPRFENLFSALVLLPETEFDRVLVSPDSARSEGVEALVRMQQRGSWGGWLSYTWSRSRDRIDGSYVARSWDQTHAVSLGLSWLRGPWAVTVADTFHSGWPTTELQMTPTTGGSPQFSFGPRNSKRFNHYNSFDMRIARTFALSKGALDAYVEVTNAFSRTNPCCVNYTAEQATNGAYFARADIDHWLPLVPSAGVLWRY
jgi:hypothetical protein